MINEKYLHFPVRKEVGSYWVCQNIWLDFLFSIFFFDHLLYDTRRRPKERWLKIICNDDIKRHTWLMNNSFLSIAIKSNLSWSKWIDLTEPTSHTTLEYIILIIQFNLAVLEARIKWLTKNRATQIAMIVSRLKNAGGDVEEKLMTCRYSK